MALAIHLFRKIKTEAAHIPAVAEPRFQPVRSGGQRDLIGLIRKPALILAAAGREKLISKLLAVQIQLIQAQTAGINAAFRAIRRDLKLPHEHRRLPFRQGRTDPFCRPRLVKRGEVRGLIGENGSGKSTVTSIFSGMQPADSGEMFYRG